jgi:hypothetical protein
MTASDMTSGVQSLSSFSREYSCRSNNVTIVTPALMRSRKLQDQVGAARDAAFLDQREELRQRPFRAVASPEARDAQVLQRLVDCDTARFGPLFRGGDLASQGVAAHLLRAAEADLAVGLGRGHRVNVNC